MSKFLVLMIAIIAGNAAVAQSIASAKKWKLVFEDDFSRPEPGNSWLIETSDTNGCIIVNGQLQLNTHGGITLWYKNRLAGNVLIEYDRTVMVEGKANDRLSDMNQFWMATDPQQKMFSRKGNFREYDSLQMYYVGMGGNYNTTTRMRRYDGKGTLQIIGEYRDSAHLLKPNRKYHLAILMENGVAKFFTDGKEYFSFKDDKPFNEGWFAIRSTKSRQLIDNVKIYSER